MLSSVEQKQRESWCENCARDLGTSWWSNWTRQKFTLVCWREDCYLKCRSRNHCNKSPPELFVCKPRKNPFPQLIVAMQICVEISGNFWKEFSCLPRIPPSCSALLEMDENAVITQERITRVLSSFDSFSSDNYTGQGTIVIFIQLVLHSFLVNPPSNFGRFACSAINIQCRACLFPIRDLYWV